MGPGGRHGAYYKRFTCMFAPDKSMSFMVLRYSGSLSRGDRVSLRETFTTAGCLEVFMGRMDFLKGAIANLVRAWKIPAGANPINSLITHNSIFLFALPCCVLWKMILKSIKNSEAYRNGCLSVHQFYLGFNAFPVDYLEIISADICIGHSYLQMPNSLTVRKLVDNVIQDVGTSLHQISTKMLVAISELASDKISCVHMDLHRTISDLVAKGHSSDVLKEMDYAFTERYSEFRIQIMQGLGNHQLLQRICDFWMLEKSFLVVRCKSFFSLLETEKPNSIMKLGQRCWLLEVILSPKLDLVDRVLGLVNNERDGASLDRLILINMVGMFNDLGPSIKDSFESQFLTTTAKHYEGEYHRLSQSLSGVDHLKALHSLLASEVDRTALYITGKSREKLMSVLGNIVLGERSKWILTFLAPRKVDDEVDLCMAKHLKDIANIYHFLENALHGQSMLVAFLRNCFDNSLSILTKDASTCKDPAELIMAILNFMKSAHKLIGTVLKGGIDFSEQLDCSVGEVLNSNKFYAEFISLYVDAKFQKAARGDLDDALDGLGDLVQLLNDKDVFELYHRKHLLLRIISDRADDQMELKILYKLEALGIDVFKSRCILRDFKESTKTMKDFDPTPSVSVNVISGYAWPKSSGTTCMLPSDVSEVCKQYEQHYLKSPNHLRRQISWQTDKGLAVLTGNFGGKIYDLQVSTHQMCILMLFNSTAYLSFDNIKEQTGILDGDLQTSLLSLCTSNVLLSLDVDFDDPRVIGYTCDSCVTVTFKVRVEASIAVAPGPETDDALVTFNGADELLSASQSVEEDEGSVNVTLRVKTVKLFYVNDFFMHNSDQIPIFECIAKREPEEQKVATLQSVNINRDPQLEAAIIWIMKRRKRLSHGDLVLAVMEKVQEFFQPDHADIKRIIEKLIESEHIERNKKNPLLYRYIE